MKYDFMLELSRKEKDNHLLGDKFDNDKYNFIKGLINNLNLKPNCLTVEEDKLVSGDAKYVYKDGERIINIFRNNTDYIYFDLKELGKDIVVTYNDRINMVNVKGCYTNDKGVYYLGDVLEEEKYRYKDEYQITRDGKRLKQYFTINYYDNESLSYINNVLVTDYNVAENALLDNGMISDLEYSIPVNGFDDYLSRINAFCTDTEGFLNSFKTGKSK